VGTPEITTARLRLRGWRDSDRDAFAAMNADPIVMEHFPGTLDRAASDGMIDRMRSHWEAEGFGLWAIEALQEGTFVGFVGLTRPTFDAHFTPAVEVGFETFALKEIVSFTVPANTRSIAVMERLGMTTKPGDDFDHPRLPEGHALRRHVLYRLPRAAWERRTGTESG